MPLLPFINNFGMGGAAATPALSHTPFKALTLEFGGGLGQTLAFKGNTLPLPTVTTIPTVEPPGDKGMVFYVSSGVLTIYVWDTVTNAWLAHGAANATLISDLEAFAFMGYDG